MAGKIDFVIPWVDGADPEWRAKKNKYKAFKQPSAEQLISSDDREMRYMDWGLLKYWFRGVEKYAPWVNHIYFVTDHQIPDWMNTSNPKLTVVFHEDYIPGKYLPTFATNTIELNFHRIKGLSEQFVYFNDDMFITDDVKPKDFFWKGKPRDCAILNVKTFDSRETLGFSQVVSTAIMNKYYDEKEVIRKNIFKWFTPVYGLNSLRTLLLMPWKRFPGFYIKHLPTNILKSTCSELWDKEYDMFDTACMHKIRDYNDVNQWIFGFWQICKGQFIPQRVGIGKAFTVGTSVESDQIVCDSITKRKYKLLCIGEDENVTDFDTSKKMLIKAFETVLDQKSSFEK